MFLGLLDTAVDMPNTFSTTLTQCGSPLSFKLVSYSEDPGFNFQPGGGHS